MKNELLLSEQFKKFITACSTGRKLGATGKRVTKGTIINYTYAQKLLIDFEAKYNLKLRIQLLHRASIRMLQKEKNYWSKFYTQFSSFLYNHKGFSDNYVNNTFKLIKLVFNYLQTDKGYSVGNYHKSFKIPLLKKSPVVLQPSQLHFLISEDNFINTLSPTLKKTRDIFVFGCTVALRVSDLIKLKKNNLNYVGNECYLKLYTQKTGVEVKIPIPDYAIDIIEKYKKRAGKYILPRFTITNFNIQCKELIKKAGWTYPLPKQISKQGRFVEITNSGGKSWGFHQHITAHTMRRTAITTLLIMGVAESVVRKISGHAPGSKEFYRYVAIADEYMNKEVKNAHKKLMETSFQ
ncbi:MAG: site-specific integrase [Bacteroidota bacterium]